MNRIEIETKLNKDRAWLLDAFSQMSEEDLWRGVTASEHDVDTEGPPGPPRPDRAQLRSDDP